MEEAIQLINRLLDKIDKLEEVNRNVKKYADIQDRRRDEVKATLNQERALTGSYKKELEKLKEENKRLNKEAIKLLDENVKLKGEITNE